MYSIKSSNDQSLLYDKGTLLPSGEICKNKINLISGTITTPFVEAIWTFTEKDAEAMERITSILNHLYRKGLETEMMVVLRILLDILGLKYSEDVELLASY